MLIYRQVPSRPQGARTRQTATTSEFRFCRLKRRAAAPFGCTAVAGRIPGRYRHVIFFHHTAILSIIRPFFGQDCTECWRLVDPTDSRPSPSDDIGRKRETPMNSTPTPKAIEPHNALMARARGLTPPPPPHIHSPV